MCTPASASASAGTVAGPVLLAPASPIGVAQSGDVVQLHIAGEDDLSGAYTVAQDGTITLPLVGAIPVNGKTLDEITAAIGDAYREGYLVAPVVSVDIERGQI